MYIIKADGRREEFQPRKIIGTCVRAGASRKTAVEIAKKVSSEIREGDTTQKIYGIIIAELEKREDRTSFVFTLRESIARMDSISFELYVKDILEAYGYNCDWNKIIKGRYVEHQVDVVAEKGGEIYLIECKHHTNHHRFCGLGTILEVQARLEDIADGFENKKNRYDFKMAWVVTNTKFSDHAKKYAKGENIRLTGWRSKEFSLDDMIGEKSIFPITILRDDFCLQKKLLEQGIIILQDLLTKEIKDVSKNKIDELKNQAKDLLK
jgi:hypothetical protein